MRADLRIGPEWTLVAAQEAGNGRCLLEQYDGCCWSTNSSGNFVRSLKSSALDQTNGVTHPADVAKVSKVSAPVISGTRPAAGDCEGRRLAELVEALVALHHMLELVIDAACALPAGK